MYRCIDHPDSFLSIHALPAAMSAAALGAKLRWNRFSPAYRKRLVEGAVALDAYLERCDIQWNFVEKNSARSVDELLDAFVKEMHSLSSRGSLRVAKHAVLFVQCTRPRLKRNLGATWNSIRSWEEQRPSGFRPPLPIVLLAAMICMSRKLASETSGRASDLWFRFSTMLAIGFFGLLRPGEMFKLQRRHITLPNAVSLGAPFAVMLLEQPKNARQMGKQQFSVLRHPDAVNWLSWLTMSSQKSREALWPSAPSRFRVMFKEICEKLGVGRLKLSPASLRAGGATWMLDEGTEVSKIRFMGRWSNLRSLERYLQVARAQQIALTLEPTAVAAVKHLLINFSFMLTLPDHFAATVPKEHLVESRLFECDNESHVVTCIRSWAQLASCLQEGRCGGRSTERSTLP